MPLNILVYCHIYDNKYKTAATGDHPPLFLFLYENETYKKIELTKNNLDDLATKNIHVKFFDINSSGVDEYQKNYITLLNGIQFDYIFPIHCPFGGSSAPTEALELLKPTGKYMYNDYRIRGTEDFSKSLDKTEYIKEKRDLLDKLINRKGKSNVQTIAFHNYKETKEPYVYLTDIDEGVGWFDIYTRELLEQAQAPPPLPEAQRQAQADAPPTLPQTPALPLPKSAASATTIIQRFHSQKGCWGSSCWSGGTRRKKTLNRTKSIKKRKRSKKRKNRSVFRKKSLHLRATS
jgi:hypothetical protein